MPPLIPDSHGCCDSSRISISSVALNPGSRSRVKKERKIKTSGGQIRDLGAVIFHLSLLKETIVLVSFSVLQSIEYFMMSV